ncbi:hypothetical protein [Brevibacillus laterosporus]|nr:hypothetical protein [Brevibacillus laterosporus]MED1666452.1 hypothetical protein [Brevibacillus laterosporus]MED1667514.1 hypothetical protein [Brevibacillus laterosporus]MED1719318.1 hypothetical protein [Brevibacillus laterosporus]
MAWDDWVCNVYTIKKENYQSGKESFHSSSPYLYVSISTVINVNAILLIW